MSDRENSRLGSQTTHSIDRGSVKYCFRIFKMKTGATQLGYIARERFEIVPALTIDFE